MGMGVMGVFEVLSTGRACLSACSLTGSEAFCDVETEMVNNTYA